MDKKQLKALREQRDARVSDLEAIVTTARDEAREFTLDEAEKRGALNTQITALDDQIRAGEKEVRQARKEAKAAEARNQFGYSPVGLNAPGGSVKVTGEHRTYERGNGLSYLQDLCIMSFGPGATQGRYFEAVERMQRHSLETITDALEIDDKAPSQRTAVEQYRLGQVFEAARKREDNPRAGARSASYEARHAYAQLRALSTAAGAGGEFVPPMYLTEDWVAFMRAGRVVADNQHHEPLPDGTMSINIPKVSGGTSVATQGTQNTNVSDTDLQTEYVTFPVVTKAGAQIVSLQLIERSPVAFDRVVTADLAKAYAQQVDIAVLAGPGSGDVTGIMNTSGINTVTWTQAAPTVKGLYGQIGVAKADIATSLFLPATHAFMTPTRWEWIGQTFDTNGRPLVVPSYQGPFNVLQVAPNAATAEGVVGRDLSGLATFEDANIPSNLGSGTNQDVVVLGRMEENYLFESPVVTRALPQTYGTQLSVLLQLYGYIAFTAARYPNANAVITGTGLVPPTFNS